MSIGKFVCILFCIGLLFSPSASALENCITPPTCEELGFTANIEDCAGAALKCPWDLSKAACNQTQTCSGHIGDILFGDGSCSSTIVEGKTPIGVIFDETNRLAVALTDVKKDGSPGSEGMSWSSSYCDIPNLTNCDDSYNRTCGTDGRANTDAILATNGGCSGTTYAALASNTYEPQGCSSPLCKRGKWFLPSFPDLMNLCDEKSTIYASIDALKSWGGTKPEDYKRYWSSTESIYLHDFNPGRPVEVNYLFLSSCGGGNIDKLGDSDRRVRPVVKY